MLSAVLRPHPLSRGLLRLVLSICATLMLAAGAHAARQAAPAHTPPTPTPAPVPAVDATPVEEADLILMNRTIVRFRGKLLGATPRQRAERGQATITTILERATGNEVVVQSNPVGNIVLIDGQLAFIVTDADTDKLAGETLDALTQKSVATLGTVIAESRESRDSRLLAEGLAKSAGATLVFFALLYALGRLRGWVAGKLAGAIDRQSERLKLGGTELIRRDRILAAIAWMSAAIFWLVAAVLAYAWIARVLAIFPYTRAWGEQLDDYLLGVLARLGLGVLETVPNLLIALLMFLLARAVVGLLKPVFDHVAGDSAGLGWLDKDTVEPTRKITNILIWIFALVMAYPYLPGAQTEAFKGMSVLIGLMVSLGASSIVGQGASGLILMYSRTLRSGEYVRIGEHEGTVVAISLFNTRLRTGRGAEITLPNALIVGSATRNYSRTQGGRGFMLDTTVTIGYDTPWRQVEAMLTEAARRTPGISTDPAPRIFQTALSDFYPEYCLVVHATPVGAEPRAQLLSRLHANIQDVFNEYGVQIMSPHYIDDPASEKVVPQASWYTAPARKPDPA
ncbi:MAG: mechanosensitive ion channel family protein [Zoogloea sp.]|nr:mechanosensitive ion channel family protein [Zoogloea sp.]